MKLRYLLGEHCKKSPRAASELEHPLGAGANRLVEILVALGPGVQGRVEVGWVLTAHPDDLRRLVPSGSRKPE